MKGIQGVRLCISNVALQQTGLKSLFLRDFCHLTGEIFRLKLVEN